MFCLYRTTLVLSFKKLYNYDIVENEKIVYFMLFINYVYYIIIHISEKKVTCMINMHEVHNPHCILNCMLLASHDCMPDQDTQWFQFMQQKAVHREQRGYCWTGIHSFYCTDMTLNSRANNKGTRKNVMGYMI